MDRQHESRGPAADRGLATSRTVRHPIRVVADRHGYSTLVLDSFGLDRTGVLFRLVDRVYRAEPRLRPEHIAGSRAGDYYHLQLVYRHLAANGPDDIDPRMEAAVEDLGRLDRTVVEGGQFVTAAAGRLVVTGPHEARFVRDVLAALAEHHVSIRRVTTRSAVPGPGKGAAPDRGAPVVRLGFQLGLSADQVGRFDRLQQLLAATSPGVRVTWQTRA